MTSAPSQLLSRIAALRVTSRTSCMQYKASTLGAREIVAALGITPAPAEDRRLAQRGFKHVEAYDLFLEAREQLRGMILVSDAWDALITRAISIEGPVPALVGLRLWGELSRLKAGIGDRATLDGIERQARELVALAPDEPWGYGILGYAAFERGEQVQAIQAFQQAIARDPTDTPSRVFLSIAFAYAALPERCVESAEQMLAVDPLAPLALLADSIKSWFTGGMAASMPAVHHAVAADPENLLTRWTLAYGLTALRELDAAAARALVDRLDLTPFDSHLTFHFAEVFAVLGEEDRAIASEAERMSASVRQALR